MANRPSPCLILQSAKRQEIGSRARHNVRSRWLGPGETGEFPLMEHGPGAGPGFHHTKTSGAPSFSRSLREGGALEATIPSGSPATMTSTFSVNGNWRKSWITCIKTRSNAGWSFVRRIGSGVVPSTIRRGWSAQWRLNLIGQPEVVRSLAGIRWSAAATSAKGPALSQRTREGQGTRFCGW